MSGDSSTLKTLSGSNDAGAGAGAAGSAGASASASAGASDSVASARRGDFTGLGILGTKPALADIERIRSVVRILLLYRCGFCTNYYVIAMGVCTVLQKIVTSLAGRLSALLAAKIFSQSSFVLSMLSLGLAPASGAKTAPDAYNPLV